MGHQVGLRGRRRRSGFACWARSVWGRLQSRLEIWDAALAFIGIVAFRILDAMASNGQPQSGEARHAAASITYIPIDSGCKHLVCQRQRRPHLNALVLKSSANLNRWQGRMAYLLPLDLADTAPCHSSQ
jgi:hypothetical protein